MQLFDGASWQRLPESVEAQDVFAPMSNEELRECVLADIVHPGSCLVPLGLQQNDFAPRNIVARFNPKAGYISSSWIDLE